MKNRPKVHTHGVHKKVINIKTWCCFISHFLQAHLTMCIRVSRKRRGPPMMQKKKFICRCRKFFNIYSCFLYVWDANSFFPGKCLSPEREKACCAPIFVSCWDSFGVCVCIKNKYKKILGKARFMSFFYIADRDMIWNMSRIFFGMVTR